jgi:hypothetical protein
MLVGQCSGVAVQWGVQLDSQGHLVFLVRSEQDILVRKPLDLRRDARLDCFCAVDSSWAHFAFRRDNSIDFDQVAISFEDSASNRVQLRGLLTILDKFWTIHRSQTQENTSIPAILLIPIIEKTIKSREYQGKTRLTEQHID